MTTTFTTGFGGETCSDPRAAAGRTAGIVSILVLAAGLGGFALGIDWAWVVFPVGYGAVLPLAIGRSVARAKQKGGDASATSSHSSHSGRHGDQAGSDPLATLRERYARGEIDDAEFERKVERLLETESTEY